MRNPSSPGLGRKNNSSSAHHSGRNGVCLTILEIINGVPSSEQSNARNYFSPSRVEAVDDSSLTNSRKRTILRMLGLFRDTDMRENLGLEILASNVDKNELCGRIITTVLNMMDDDSSYEVRQQIIDLMMELIAILAV